MVAANLFHLKKGCQKDSHYDLGTHGRAEADKQAQSKPECDFTRVASDANESLV
jgi:hypothetical protein